MNQSARAEEKEDQAAEIRRLEALVTLERRMNELIEGSLAWSFALRMRRLAKRFQRPAAILKRLIRGKPRMPTVDELIAKKLDSPEGRPDARCGKVSVIVPLFNTPIDFLREMISSVVTQSYSDWELCLADGSDADHDEVGKTAREFADRDKRIRYRRLERNLGIVGNSNAAIDLATGDVIALLDHDDILHPDAVATVAREIAAGADFVYTDEATFDSATRRVIRTARKPGFDLDYLRGVNYICHFSAFRRTLLDAAGRFRSGFDGAQDHDLILRLAEKAGRIVRVPEILYFWRAHSGSTAMASSAKNYAGEAGVRAVAADLERRGIAGTVEVLDSRHPTMYRVRYSIVGNPLVSIVIPTRDHCADMKRCLDSIFARTTYPDYEITIVDNGSTERKLLEYYRELEKRANVRIVHDDGNFNFSRINNFAVSESRGEYVLFLNNDTEVISPNWIEEMLMFAQRRDIGAVGAKLIYPDGRIQHGGVVLGVGGLAGHAFLNARRSASGYLGRLSVPCSYSAMTAAAMMVRREYFDAAGGFEEALAVAFNDVDLAMKLRRLGKRNVWTPFAELYHYESKSRGDDTVGIRRKRALAERWKFWDRWAVELAAGDEFYNPAFGFGQPTFTERFQ